MPARLSLVLDLRSRGAHSAGYGLALGALYDAARFLIGFLHDLRSQILGIELSFRSPEAVRSRGELMLRYGPKDLPCLALPCPNPLLLANLGEQSTMCRDMSG